MLSGKYISDSSFLVYERIENVIIMFCFCCCFFNINLINPWLFSSAELAICGLPILFESVTLDSLGNPQLADALTHLKKTARR